MCLGVNKTKTGWVSTKYCSIRLGRGRTGVGSCMIRVVLSLAVQQSGCRLLREWFYIGAWFSVHGGCT